MARVTGRQAVVLIHGIGEHVPMDTLRGFVQGLDFHGAVLSKRHRFSVSHELRRFTLPRAAGKRPPTDFFELYWAHHLERGRARETLAWSARLLLRWPFTRFDPSLRPAVAIAQLVMLGLLAAATVVLVSAFASDNVSALAQVFAGLVLVAGSFSLVIGRFFRKPLADAARYLTPRPSNITGRDAIRDEGLQLLRALHDSGEYMRIVVVGHSLGSVIGYDILRSLWDEYRHPGPAADASVSQPELEGIDELGRALSASPSRGEVDAFQQAQHRAWRENRSLGVRWLVSDFLTLGSPLAHGRLLLKSGLADLEQRQREREYPINPPVTDMGGQSSFRQLYELSGGERRSLLVGNEAAIFAATRWTNLYFPVRWGFKGDLVGGPLSTVFGPGILDIALRSPRNVARLRTLFPWAHSNYWRPSAAGSQGARIERRRENRATGPSLADYTLKEALHLDLERSQHAYPAPPDPNEERPFLLIKLGNGKGLLRRV